MKILFGAGIAFLLRAASSAFLVMAPVPARADTTSDLAQCEKMVKFKTGDVSGVDVAACMQTAGYRLDSARQMDVLTECGTLSFPGIEMRCYRKDGVTEAGPVPPPVTTDWQTRKIDDLLAQEADSNDKCRANGPTVFYTQDICNRRDRLVMVLKARGWCFQAPPGKAESEANRIWQACRKDQT
jgi:hypothetical protein